MTTTVTTATTATRVSSLKAMTASATGDSAGVVRTPHTDQNRFKNTAVFEGRSAWPCRAYTWATLQQSYHGVHHAFFAHCVPAEPRLLQGTQRVAGVQGNARGQLRTLIRGAPRAPWAALNGHRCSAINLGPVTRVLCIWERRANQQHRFGKPLKLFGVFGGVAWFLA